MHDSSDSAPVTTRRTGTIQKFVTVDGTTRYRARIRLADGSRPWIDAPLGYTEARAREFARALQERENATGELIAAKRAADARKRVPVDATAADRWVHDWIATKAAKGQTSTADRLGHWRHHIREAVAGRHVRDWTSEDLRELVARLDGKIASGTMSAKTAANVWGTATRMCGDAVASKVAALRCRDHDPSRDVEGPERGVRLEKQYLYPGELVRLLACAEIPLRWRRAIAIATYTGLRVGELRALRWDHVDLAHGIVHVHRAFDRRARAEKATKSRAGRRFALEPAIMPLLEAMHAESGGTGLVCPLPNRLADRLREWLERAGVTRRELLDDVSETTRAIGFHDLRATFLTWLAVRGDEPLKIMQRAGHRDLATTQGYVRTAEAVGVAAFGEVFPVLPSGLLEASETASGLRRRSKRSQPLGIIERGTGFEPATSSLGSWHSTN